MATTSREPNLEGTSVVAVLVYCVFLAGIFYVLTHTPGPSAVFSTAMIDSPLEIVTDETIGYR
jgi:hypothetical protein